MSAAPPPAGEERRRRPWAPFLAELKRTAAQTAWGVWVLCVLLLVAFAVALGAAVIGVAH